MTGLSEFAEVMPAALQASEPGERVALATVVRVRGSAPRHESARMLVWHVRNRKATRS
ncbi:MAG TPA: XdhC family protein [Anaerolineales bacterium]|nr:XdhC family protein [Anaerolineales bacterium]